eukprot:CAMPEP_0118926906 /NCGR_PEP_ID=MMETSP1169-20130426/4512_1 /TAXON_ID=36882 /ORGANISM="Pyramimonas obovata, Strain CCMP722" /LENGTH=83 /DNA_ID=CAMNT_0006868563 /DNA_START=98 /DNA_END=350 /DNA_ORIENTATION=+
MPRLGEVSELRGDRASYTEISQVSQTCQPAELSWDGAGAARHGIRSKHYEPSSGFGVEQRAMEKQQLEPRLEHQLKMRLVSDG